MSKNIEIRKFSPLPGSPSACNTFKGITNGTMRVKDVSVAITCNDGEKLMCKVTSPIVSIKNEPYTPFGSSPYTDINISGFLMNKREWEPEIKRGIKRVIFNDPVTVVIWADGTKTIVRCQDGEPYDPEKGLAICMAKKMLGNNGNYYDIFHKYLDAYEEEEAMKKKLAKAVKKKAKKGKKK